MKHEKLPIAEAPPPQGFWSRLTDRWNAFWFTPTDPTLLGFMRIWCGLITLYTVFSYSLVLDDFVGPHAWHDLQLRNELIKEQYFPTTPLTWLDNPFQAPANDAQQRYVDAYLAEFGDLPPPPYPKDKGDEAYLRSFRQKWKFDLRFLGLHPPRTDKQTRDLEEYTKRYPGQAMPAYPATDEEKAAVYEFMDKNGIDPRRVYAIGNPVWSVWLHVTDPKAMAVIHGLFLLVTFLFTIGFCTRLTSVLTWFAGLCYIHRNHSGLFGVDTMMNILLIYFMIGPSGAALSVDRLIGRWWSKARARFFGGPPLAFDETPQPRVSANLAIRLIQIHTCIIYGVAGLSKLNGDAWWNGTAVWGTLGNFEFAPMQWAIYNEMLRLLGSNRVLFESFITFGTYFTLIFEIGYPFAIWRPALRWPWLAAAILLHGVIGVFMGLLTFALIMLVMNMAFLTPQETRWLLSFFDFRDSKPAAA